jgi:hypothetical protein
MKKLVLLSALLLSSCMDYHLYVVDLKGCDGTPRGTVYCYSLSGPPVINTYKEAIPVLYCKDSEQNDFKVLNVCDLKILSDSPL